MQHILLNLWLLAVALAPAIATAGQSISAHWNYNHSDSVTASRWSHDGIITAIDNPGATMQALHKNGHPFKGKISTKKPKKRPVVKRMKKGDCLLFTIPSVTLPAGCDVDFSIVITSADDNAPRYWLCEILDGDRWVAPSQEFLRNDPDGTPYSFDTLYFKSHQYTTFSQTFSLKHPIADGPLRVRCRVSSNRDNLDRRISPDSVGKTLMPAHEYTLASLTAWPGSHTRDSHKAGILGNSFTYYNGSPFMLKAIARSQGHRLDLNVNTKGGQYLRNHLTLEQSRHVTDGHGYDYVILQDQSRQHSRYDVSHNDTILTETRTLSAAFRENSPNATIILENTWAYPADDWAGFHSDSIFSGHLQSGARLIAEADTNIDRVSPIAVAFDKARAQGIPDLYAPDGSHPALNGTYLKACVNYLVIFGQPFDANVPDCGCVPDVASKLRAIAEQTVLGNDKYHSKTR